MKERTPLAPRGFQLLGGDAQGNYCFRTDKRGRLYLNKDWLGIFERMQILGSYNLLSRQSHARLILQTSPLWFQNRDGQLMAHYENGVLSLDTSRILQAEAVVERCSCCNSSGHIEFQSSYRDDFLRLTCPARVSAEDWAYCIGPLMSEESLGKLDRKQSKRGSWNYLPEGVSRSPLEVEQLELFVDGIMARGARIKVFLCSKEFLHMHEFQPVFVQGHPGILLDVKGAGCCFQVSLAHMAGLYVHMQSSVRRLYMAGDYGDVIAVMGACSDSRSEAAWDEALEDCS